IWTLNVNKIFEEAPPSLIQNEAPAEAKAEARPRQRKAKEKAPSGIIVSTMRWSGVPTGAKRHYNDITHHGCEGLGEARKQFESYLSELDAQESFGKREQWREGAPLQTTIRKREEDAS